MRILIVEDDCLLAEAVSDYFSAKGWQTEEAHDGNSALEMAASGNWQMILLDVMLPGMDGFSVCREIRRSSDVPVFFITARVLEADELNGYAVGADDYVTKPFSLPVLYAKVMAMMGRIRGGRPEERVRRGDVEVEAGTRKVYVQGKERFLPPKEFEMLLFFLENPNRTFTREQLLIRFWGYDFDGNERVVDNHIKKLRKALQSLSDDIRWIQTQLAQEAADEGVSIGREWVGNTMDYILAVNEGAGELPYMLWSGAVWDEDGDKIAESGPVYTMMPGDENENGPLVWRLDEWLTEEELDQLAEYDAKTGRSMSVYEQEEWTEYQENASMDRNGEPAEITVLRESWRKATQEEAENWIGKMMTIDNEQSYICENSEEVWSWENPDAAKGRKELGVGNLSFPAQSQGKSCWEEWKKDEYLTGFPDQIQGGYNTEGTEYTEYAADKVDSEVTIPLLFGDADSGSGVQTCTMKLRMTSHSWLAALDYMKYVYVSGALLLLVCILIVWRTLEKSYRNSAQAEAYRRDFTNAMAHEMKTPLSVIRGFSENLKENPDTGKREYYLDQIIGQTEEMDNTVKEMIQVSKLDSDELNIQKEKISLRDLLEQETERIALRTEERRIRVEIRCDENAEVEGDRKMLEKAFRCLLDNAVSYNRDEGRIRINADREKCVIANTGEQIPEEELPHVCEMLRRGGRESRERASGEKHLGMGLYLADRIFRLHGMELKVENTAEGVQVSVKW